MFITNKFETSVGLRSFCGDVVLDSFNKVSRDEDNILDQILKFKYVRLCFVMILILYNIIQKYILTQQ